MQKKHKLPIRIILIFVAVLFVNLIFKSAAARADDIPYTLDDWKNSRTINLGLHALCDNIDVGARCTNVSDNKTYVFCGPNKRTLECHYPKCGPIGSGSVSRSCPAGYECQTINSPNNGEYKGCVSLVLGSTPTEVGLSKLQADLSARKPILQINIPGLNFSNVASTTDETGTYFYIAWIPELISALYKFGIAIVSIVAVVMIILQGIKIASGGFISKTIKEGGKDVVISAYKNIGRIVVGLMIAWGSFAILYNINPALVQFNALKVRVVEREEFPVSTSDEDPNDVRTVDTPGTGKVPYFAQYDPRWGNLKPGDPQWPFNTAVCKNGFATIMERGCGPTSMAMVLKYLGKDVTPIDTAKFALGCSGGMSAPAVNKNWSKGPWSDLKFEAYINSDRALALAIQNIPLILGCRPCIGYTTDGKIQTYSAHYMVITGSNDGGVTFSINDPGARKGIVKMTRDQMLNPQKDQAVQGCNSKSKPDKRSACINGLKEMRKPNFYYIHK